MGDTSLIKKKIDLELDFLLLGQTWGFLNFGSSQSCKILILSIFQRGLISACEGFRIGKFC